MSDTLDLQLQKQFAIEFIQGKKVRDFRAFNDFYVRKLGVVKDGEVLDIKKYEKVNFRDRMNRWHLLMKVEGIALLPVNDEFLRNFDGEVEIDKEDIKKAKEVGLEPYMFVIKAKEIIEHNVKL